jgi:lysozyme
MKTSPAGVAVIKHFESFRSVRYICSGGRWTIGWGHTKGVTEHTKPITMAEGEMLLREDLAEFEDAVTDMVVVPLDQGQFDALVSFSFNLGAGALRNSTLLKMLNQGNTAGAANQFQRWTKAKGRVLNGLVKRRAAEAAMFRGQA